LPAAGAGKLFASATSSQGQGRIAVSLPSSLGPDPRVTAHVLTPNLRSSTLQLQPSSPGQYGGTFEESGQGSYFVTVDATGAGHANAGQVALNVPYSPEYRSTGLDLPFLRALAAAGGGSIIKSPGDIWANNLPAVLQDYDITGWLLLLALLLLPVDVGVRRLVVSRRELAAILAAVPIRRQRAVPEVGISLVEAVRERRMHREAIHEETAAGPLRVPVEARRAARAVPSGSSRAMAPQVADPPAPEEAGAEPESESLASKLLAARRRRE
jgi:hypothetical protein